MNKTLLAALAALIATTAIVASSEEASAYVAVRRGAVVRPHGAVVVRRPVHRGVVVVR